MFFVDTKMESKQANDVKDTADSKEGPTCVIDEIPTEIIMITVKMLPNFEGKIGQVSADLLTYYFYHA